VRIGANCDLRECIIGRDVHIADGVKIGRGALIGNGVRRRAEDDDEEEEDEEEESEEEKGKSSIKVRAVADFSPTRKNPWQRLCGSSLASGGGRTSRRLGR
jgi:hypothetical protein